MKFHNIYSKYKDFDFNNFLDNVSESDVKRNIGKKKLSPMDFLSLLSLSAEPYLEEIAQIAHKITLLNFGRTIQIYTPIYLSNHCQNECLYCGFNVKNKIPRKKLTLQEVEKESKIVAETGLRHILILTGESRKETPVSYIKDCVKILKKYFSSICLEIYPLTQDEYKLLIEEGVDGLTLYQETYDENTYSKLHLSGPKKDYSARLETPEFALKAGIRTVNLGALLGLSNWQREAFFTALHAQFLQDKFPEAEISISIPRVRPQNADFKSPHIVSDRNLVQIILAIRLFLPRIGITLSTRESANLRENLLPLGVTKISAGSVTSVGGRIFKNSKDMASVQFGISDERDVDKIKDMILAKGYQPVFKDWMPI